MKRKSVSWVNAVKSIFSPVRKKRGSAKLGLESLDSRIVPATISASGDSLVVDGGPNSLRDAINTANNNADATNTIVLSADNYTIAAGNKGAAQENANKKGDFDIFNNNVAAAPVKTYIFQGAGVNSTIIDANDVDRVFQILGTNVIVKFQNLTIQDGTAFDDGTAGVQFLGANQTDAKGGGVLNGVPGQVGGADLSFTNVAIRSNFAGGTFLTGANGTNGTQTAAGAGKAGTPGTDGKNAYGGGVYSNGGTLTITGSGSLMTGNVATAGWGGIGGNGGTATATSKAGGKGGRGGDGGDAFGGGVYSEAGSVIVSGGAVVQANVLRVGAGGTGGNGGSASKAFGLGGTGGAGGNGGAAGGAGIYMANGDVTISGAQVIQNLVATNLFTRQGAGGSGGSGGNATTNGVGGRGGDGGNGGSVMGGGIAVATGNVTLSAGAIVSSNSVATAAGSAQLGGGAAGNGGNANATNGVGGTGGNGGNGGSVLGAGIYAGTGSVTIGGGSKVQFNSATMSSEAAGGRGGNGGTANGGGVAGAGGNGGQAKGGGVYLASGTFTLNGGAAVSNNNISGGTGGNGGSGGTGFNKLGVGGTGGQGGNGGNAFGGGVYVESGDVVVNSGHIDGNFVDAESGGSGGNGGKATGTSGRGAAGGNGGTGTLGLGGGLYSGNGTVSITGGATINGNVVGADSGGNGGDGGAGDTLGSGGNGGTGGAAGKVGGGGIYAAAGDVVVDGGATVNTNRVVGSSASGGDGGFGGAGGLRGGAGGNGGVGANAVGGGLAVAAGSVTVQGGAQVNNNSATAGDGGDASFGGGATNAGTGGKGGSGGSGGAAHGGGVWVANGTVTLTGAGQISGNSATGGSGGTGDSGGDATGKDGAGGNGGVGGEAEGGGVWVQDGAVIVSGSGIVNGNAARGSRGGSADSRGSKGAGTAPNGNGGDGGDARGGGIYAGAATITISGRAQITNNAVTGGVGGNQQFAQNGGDGGKGGAGGDGIGGGVYGDTGNVSITTSLVGGNFAGGNDGGAGGGAGLGLRLGGDGGLSAGGGIAVIGGSVTLDGANVTSNFVGNDADGGAAGLTTSGNGGDSLGGGLYAPASSPSVSVTNSSFFFNSASSAGDAPTNAVGGDSLGGGIYSDSPSTLISNSTVAINFVGSAGAGATPGLAEGGGVHINSAAGAIRNTTVVQNFAAGFGGGIRNQGKLALDSTIVGRNNLATGGFVGAPVNGVQVGTGADISNSGTITGANNLVESNLGAGLTAANGIVGKTFLNPVFDQSANVFTTGSQNTVYVDGVDAGAIQVIAPPQQAPNGTLFYRLATPAEFQATPFKPSHALPLGGNTATALDNGSNIAPALSKDQIGNDRQNGTAVDVGGIEGNGLVLDTSGANVKTVAFSGIAPNTIDKAVVTFSESMQTGTFGPGDIVMTDPLGNVVTVTSVTPQAGSTTVFDVVFPSQTLFGIYKFQSGVDILDVAGNQMNQNLNKVNGELPPTSPDDLFNTTFTLFDVNDKSGATVTSAVLSGPTAQFQQALVTFSEGIDPSSVTTADFTVTDPNGGNVIITGVTPVAGSQTKFTVTFAPQSTFGGYTFTTGVDILDFAGNQMNQNGNAVNGEPGIAPTGDQFSVVQSLFDPNDTTPPTVTAATFGPGAGTFSTIQLTFSEPVQISTVTTATVLLTDTTGAPIVFTGADIVPVAPNAGAATVFDITFPAQTVFGNYTVTVTTGVRDASGNLPMDADFTQSTFLTDPSITNPPTVASVVFAPGGTSINTATITFSEPVQAATVTASVTLAGPGGAVTPLTVTPDATGTVYTVTFASQTAAGDYTLTVGTGVLNFGGIALVAPFTQTATVTGPAQTPIFAIGAADGSVQIYNSVTGGAALATIRPLDVSPTSQYTGLVEVALGDLNGDGVADLWVSAANAVNNAGLDATKAGQVFVYDGTTLLSATPTLLRSFTPFATTDGPAGTTAAYTNGINLAVGDINGDGTVDLVAGTRGGNGANTGAREIGRLAVVDGKSAAGVSTLIGSIIKPFGPGYEKGVIVAAGNADGVGGDEIAVTRGGPVNNPSPAIQAIKLKVVQLQGTTLTELPLNADGTTNFAPFAALTGPANAINRDARAAWVDTNGDGKAEVVFSALDPLTSATNSQVRIGVYAINTAATSGAASIQSTGPDAGTYTTGTAVTDHSTTKVAGTGTTQELALMTNSATPGITYLDPLTGAPVAQPAFTGLTILAGGIVIDGIGQ